MSYTVMDSLPFPRNWRAIPGAKAIIARVFALASARSELDEFGRLAQGNLGVLQGMIPAEDPDLRARLMAETDALVERELFGLTKDELHYVLDPDNVLGDGSGIETFKALRNREKRQFGEYRTQRLVLEAWDRFAGDGTLAPSAAQ